MKEMLNHLNFYLFFVFNYDCNSISSMKENYKVYYLFYSSSNQDFPKIGIIHINDLNYIDFI